MFNWFERFTRTAGKLGLPFFIGFAIARADDAITAKPDNVFSHRILPVLQEHCYGCHSDGTAEGGFSFDTVASENPADADRRQRWTVMQKLHAGTMPPVDEPSPSDPLARRQQTSKTLVCLKNLASQILNASVTAPID